MKKRGFTLIEIIICITLITIIGVGSFVGIRFVNDKIKTTKLEQITDKAIEAAQVYIETNKKSYNELYSNQNGVSIPIKLLVDEGLLDISNTTLEDKDLKDEYVVTFLGGSGGSENCEQITSSASWANDKPLYLCMKSDGSSNLAFIDPSKYGNLTTVSKEPYYFKGPTPDNYINLHNLSNNTYKTSRIYKIERDDSIVIVGNIDGYIPQNSNNIKKIYNINNQEVCNTIKGCVMYNGNRVIFESGYPLYGEVNLKNITWLSSNIVTILKPCWKISSGSGSEAEPFELTSNCP